MGYSAYNDDSRSLRAAKLNYTNVTLDTAHTVFTQQKEGKAHEQMLPSNMGGFREARDSDTHPNTIPIQLYLDVTGSMRDIPIHLIKEGLPNMIKYLQDNSVNDVALMFGAVGDHECDRAPLQIGQFESGDEELDMWLTRTWLEGGGGGNAGESYALAWFMAGNYVRTDAKDKRGQKGFVFTIGDEPVLPNYPLSAMKEIFGSNLEEGKSNYTAQELYEKACQDNHVFHIHINHNGRTTNISSILGQNCLVISDYKNIPELIAKTVLSHISITPSFQAQSQEDRGEDVKITL